MKSEELQRVIELESLFKELSNVGDPHCVDNGFFIDAVLNVTAAIKKQKLVECFDPAKMNDDIRILENLYSSIEEFKVLYRRCL